MKLKPLKNWVLVEKQAPETETKGGIFLPRVTDEPMVKARVMALGPECDSCLEKGQIVILSPFAGSELSEEENTELLVRDTDILGIVQ